MKINLYFSTLLLLLLANNSFGQNGDSWLKIAISKSGVYKLEAKELSNFSTKLKDINPDKVEFYSTSGSILPQSNAESIQKGWVAIPSKFSGKGTTISKKDYFTFFAEGAYRKDSTGSTTHSYDKHNYVFVKINGIQRRKIETHKNNSTPAEAVNKLTSTQHFEQEKYNVVKSGRDWFGDFINTEYFQKIKLEGYSSDEGIRLKSRFISTSSSTNSLNIFLNSEKIGEVALPRSFHNSNDPYDRYSRVGNEVLASIDTKSTSSDLNFRFEIGNAQKASDGAYLDWYELEYIKQNGFYSEQYIGEYKQAKSLELSLSDKAGSIWLVADPLNAQELSLENPKVAYSGTNDIKLVFFKESNLLLPAEITSVQELKPDLDITPDMLIISTKSLAAAAEKLAQYRRTLDTLDAQVVSLESVYNWYAGGKSDPTAIRNFVRDTWQKNPKRLKYLLLFGDANFDFKNNAALIYANVNSFIPAYQSRESLEPIYSFSSDDYFGFLEENMGHWVEGTSENNIYRSTKDTTEKLAIGIGRLPVKNLIEAYEAVDKIIRYETSKEGFGPWRNRITFVADDGDFNRHLQDAEQFSQQLEDNNAPLIAEKLYLDSFPQDKVENGVRSPKAIAQLNETIEQGTRIVNFNGHGSENGWTDEKLLTLDQIFRWKNKEKLPIFFTATCEYGRYDNPSLVSGAELSLLSKNNGAIALLTTTRPVFSSTNFSINRAFYEELATNENLRLGDLFKKTKNKSIAGVLNRNFTLLGDPALRMVGPKDKIRISTINQKADSIVIFNQESVVVEGFIDQESFNGTLHATFYDHSTPQKTLGESSNPAPFRSFENKLYDGTVAITNSKFTIEFVVPKTTNNALGKGKAIFYAVNSDSTQDLSGTFSNYEVKSSANSIITDNEGPLVEFQQLNSNEIVFNISDESGINLSKSSNFGFIEMKINDTLTLLLNDKYHAIRNYKKGQIKTDLPILPAGQHTIELKLSDVHNNVTSESFLLMITKSELTIEDQLAFPNPTKDITTFRFRHNQRGSDLELDLNIFDVNGKLLNSDKRQCYICDPVIEFGMNLEPILLLNGNYFYQFRFKNVTTGEVKKVGGKIIFWK